MTSLPGRPRQARRASGADRPDVRKRAKPSNKVAATGPGANDRAGHGVTDHRHAWSNVPARESTHLASLMVSKTANQMTQISERNRSSGTERSDFTFWFRYRTWGSRMTERPRCRVLKGALRSAERTEIGEAAAATTLADGGRARTGWGSHALEIATARSKTLVNYPA